MSNIDFALLYLSAIALLAVVVVLIVRQSK